MKAWTSEARIFYVAMWRTWIPSKRDQKWSPSYHNAFFLSQRSNFAEKVSGICRCWPLWAVLSLLGAVMQRSQTLLTRLCQQQGSSLNQTNQNKSKNKNKHILKGNYLSLLFFPSHSFLELFIVQSTFCMQHVMILWKTWVSKAYTRKWVKKIIRPTCHYQVLEQM